MADSETVTTNDGRRENPTLIPYSRHQVDKEDIDAVVDVLTSDWLTTGPKVDEFETAIAGFTGTQHAVAVSNGTSALHCAAYAAGIGPGDEVIVPAITFAASANCAAALGAKPVIVDVQPDTLLIDPDKIEKCVSSRTKAVIAVDYAGQPCDYDALREIKKKHGLFIIGDSCHALGARYKQTPIGQLADMTVFSFHPVKPITTGEGGMIVTNHIDLAEKMQRFRNHGIDSDLHQRNRQKTWIYEVTDLGFNYRISDFQCALGLSQLSKLEGWHQRRRTIARQYDNAFRANEQIRPLASRPDVDHAYHLYVVKLERPDKQHDRTKIFTALRKQGIGVNVHYIPLNLQPFYQERFGACRGQCPAAEAAYEKILSLPIFPAMTDQDVGFIIQTLNKAVGDPI